MAQMAQMRDLWSMCILLQFVLRDMAGTLRLVGVSWQSHASPEACGLQGDLWHPVAVESIWMHSIYIWMHLIYNWIYIWLCSFFLFDFFFHCWRLSIVLFCSFQFVHGLNLLDITHHNTVLVLFFPIFLRLRPNISALFGVQILLAPCKRHHWPALCRSKVADKRSSTANNQSYPRWSMVIMVLIYLPT